MNKQRCLLVVSGPSGAGKDTVVARLMQMHPEIEISVSATTRAPRAGEVDGVNYYYLSDAEFEAKIARGEMLEYAGYCGRYYGTPKSEVDGRLDAGTTVVLVIEVQGAANVKRIYPESTLIFLMPPGIEELRARLLGRGTESAEAVERRLERAKEEMAHAGEYDFTVVNREIDACAEEIWRILCARQSERRMKADRLSLEELRALVPKNKHDTSGIARLLRLTGDEIAPVLPALLEWLQDGNWPVARALLPVLAKHERQTAPLAVRLLQPGQTDEDWKYFLLTDLLPLFSGQALSIVLPAVQRIAAAPTQGERDCEVDAAASDFLARLPRSTAESTGEGHDSLREE